MIEFAHDSAWRISEMVASTELSNIQRLPYFRMKVGNQIVYLADESGQMSPDDLAALAQQEYVNRHADYVIVPRRYELTRNTTLGMPVEQEWVSATGYTCEECGYASERYFSLCPQCGGNDMIEPRAGRWVQREREDMR